MTEIELNIEETSPNLEQDTDPAPEKNRDFHVLDNQAPERVLLLGSTIRRAPGEMSPSASLYELADLTVSAGGLVIDSALIKRDRPDPAGYFGKGKLDEIEEIVKEKTIDLVIIDDELSVRQQNNLDRRLSCRVIDRTALILQIFADRAMTREGKLQIELAQLNYMLPRLSGMGKSMSRLGGGIGTRGPGESQLEKDRRHIRRRVGVLEEETAKIKKQRQVNRERRGRTRIPVVAIVGYTNAGKSSLLNLMTDSNAIVEDKLFATLDPVTRRLDLDGREILLTDTVGFIQNLPHTLINAFRATLEEVLYADLLIHVADSSREELNEQIRTVYDTLKEIGCEGKPMIHVFNKSDLLADPLSLQACLSEYKPAVLISVKTGEGVTRLKELVIEHLPESLTTYRFDIGVSQGRLLNHFYQIGDIIQTNYEEDRVSGLIDLPRRQAEKYMEYLTEVKERV